MDTICFCGARETLGSMRVLERMSGGRTGTDEEVEIDFCKVCLWLDFDSDVEDEVDEEVDGSSEGNLRVRGSFVGTIVLLSFVFKDDALLFCLFGAKMLFGFGAIISVLVQASANFPTTGSKLSLIPSDVKKTISPESTVVIERVKLLNSGLVPSAGPRAPSASRISLLDEIS